VTASVTTASAGATRAIGAGIARLLLPGDVVLLVGPLGAGKTTLVQGVVAALSGERAATSPTFTLAHSYATIPPVTHVDLWRLEHMQEVVDLALEEVLDEGEVVLAEWGDAAEPLYGSDALVVRLSWGPTDDERTITVEGRGPSWASRLPLLHGAVGPGAKVSGSP